MNWQAASDYMKQRQEKSLQLKSETAGPGYVAAFIDYHSYAEARKNGRHEMTPFFPQDAVRC